jgi:hypothetical protein
MTDEEREELHGTTQTHPSYAVLGISRIRGRDETLFGSSIKHHEVIRLRISPASVTRNLNRDWYRAHRDPVVEVDMSLTQFAEAITSFNMGSGVPCTIHTLNGEDIPPPEWESKREQFANEFEAKTQKVAKKFDDLVAKATVVHEKSSATKGDRAELLNMIQMLRQEIASNMPFVAESFNEQMDKTVGEAKGEVEAFFMRKVMDAGLAAVQRDGLTGEGLAPPMIEDGTEGDQA